MSSNKNIKTALDAVQGLNLQDKVYLVTGAYSGLGAATTEALLKAGATVVIAGRSEKLQTAFAEKLIANPELKITENRLDASHTIDLGNLDSVKSFARYVSTNHPKIDCIINNAGIMNTPYGKTKDSFEIQMGINVIGHFLLNKILVEKTIRQVWLSSAGHTLVGKWPGKHDLINVAVVTRVGAVGIVPLLYGMFEIYRRSGKKSSFLGSPPHRRTMSLIRLVSSSCTNCSLTSLNPFKWLIFR